MTYTATMTFTTDRPMTDAERDDFLAALFIAVDAPTDSEGDYAGWSAATRPMITLTNG